MNEEALAHWGLPWKKRRKRKIELLNLKQQNRSVKNYNSVTRNMGQDSSVGIATHYGLDGPGIKSLWGRDFLHSSRLARGAHPTSYTLGTRSFPGVKGRGMALTTHPHLVPRLKKE